VGSSRTSRPARQTGVVPAGRGRTRRIRAGRAIGASSVRGVTALAAGCRRGGRPSHLPVRFCQRKRTLDRSDKLWLRYDSPAHSLGPTTRATASIPGNRQAACQSPSRFCQSHAFTNRVHQRLCDHDGGRLHHGRSRGNDHHHGPARSRARPRARRSPAATSTSPRNQTRNAAPRQSPAHPGSACSVRSRRRPRGFSKPCRSDTQWQPRPRRTGWTAAPYCHRRRRPRVAAQRRTRPASNDAA
jgi:hypothetical protein